LSSSGQLRATWFHFGDFEQVWNKWLSGLIFCWLVKPGTPCSGSWLWLLASLALGSGFLALTKAPGNFIGECPFIVIQNSTLTRVPFSFLRGPLLNYETFLFECFSYRFNVQFSPIYFLIVAVFDCCTAADDDYDNREFPSFSMCYPQFRKLNRNWNISFLILDCSVHWLEYLVSSLTKIPPHSARLCVVGLRRHVLWLWSTAHPCPLCILDGSPFYFSRSG